MSSTSFEIVRNGTVIACVVGGIYLITKTVVKSYMSSPGMGAHADLVGNTRLIYLRHLSELLGCEIFGKAEFLNPGGSVKDRLALAVVNQILEHNRLHPDKAIKTIYEGTSGSTGISLCMAARAAGLRCVIFMPDDQAKEKRDIITALGGEVRLVRPISIVDNRHMCKAAKVAAEADPSGYFVDQFENELNFKTHFKNTAAEIIQQMHAHVNVFVASAGTGGTIAGISSRLKLEGGMHVKTILADCQGSALATKINHGTLFNPKDKEGHRIRHPIDTITEGIGLNRLTRNFALGVPFIDHGLEVSDQEAVWMAKYLFQTEGLFLGSSSAVNCACIVKAYKRGLIKPNDRIVTILCDSGQRHISKFWSDDFLKTNELASDSRGVSPLEFIS